MALRQAAVFSFIVLAWLTCWPAHATDVRGVPRIVDGDTLAIDLTKVRLEGIDAPETDQICLNAQGVHWTCGIDARDKLAKKMPNKYSGSSNGIRCLS